MRSTASTVPEYLAELAPDRRLAIETVRAALLDHLPSGLDEGIAYGMIAYTVPLSRQPHTYNGQPLMHTALASQSRHMAVYLTCLQAPAIRDEFTADYRATGKRLDMGVGCVRFRKLDDLPVDLVASWAGRLSVERLIALHDEVHSQKAVQPSKAGQRGSGRRSG